ncbi:hypothetical protein [Paractinoplanes maris]|uniref:hypothetical protein n=1 Tax=Paractinoplanes maris TaxID=1734446 RepID=UPI002021B491|nr:hypothetical protein [Actinoplanes maris]
MVVPAGARRVCPVCAEPPGDVAAGPFPCPSCGWLLRSRLRLGPPGPAAAAAFGERLSSAQRAYDLRAAAMAGVSTRLARGQGDEPPQALDAAARDTVAVDDLGRRLRDTEAHSRLMLLDIRLDGLTLWSAPPGAARLDPVWSAGWREVCPELPGHHEKRLFQLAGGVGDTPVRRAEWRRSCGAALDALAPRAEDPLILVLPPAGWRLLQTMAAVARDRLHPAAEVPAVGDAEALHRFAVAVRARIPRPEGYDVLLGRYDPAARTVRPHRQRLFAPEVVAAPREAEVTVYGAGDAVVLPVLRSGAALDDPAAGVTTVVLKLAPGERAVVTARQAGPGHVELTHPATVDDPPAWADLAGDLDALGDGDRRTPLDVALTVELGEPATARGVVAARLDHARRLVEQLTAAVPEPGRLRLGVVGYTDHQPANGSVQTTSAPLGAPAAAAGTLAGLRAATAHNDLCAPLEDALSVAGAMTWRPTSRKLLIVLAGRPPHPGTQRHYLPRCPAHLDPADAAATLPAGISVLTVLTGPALDPVTPPGRAGRDWADEVWPRLSARMPIMSEQGGHDLVDEFLTAAPDRRRLRLALTEALPSQPHPGGSPP